MSENCISLKAFVRRWCPHRWYKPANAYINNFYFKELAAIPGCTQLNACNYNPNATTSDGSCTAAKDGFDCNNNKLATDLTGATFFIRTRTATQLRKSLSHAEVALPENVVVGFEVTPGSTPVKGWSNIIHFTATGKVR